MFYYLDKLDFEWLNIVVMVCSVFGVFLTLSPLVALLWMLFYFCVGSILLLLFNLDYIAFLLVIVYAGAVVVLFLFVIMFINLRVYETALQKVSLSTIVFGVLFFLVFFINMFMYQTEVYNQGGSFMVKSPFDYNLIQMVGHLIFDYMAYEFCLIILILFVALDGILVMVFEFIEYNYKDIYMIYSS